LTELKACGAYIERREQQQLIQFLTALRSDFEGLKGSILHCSPLPSIDSVVSELLAEKICLQSYSEKKILSSLNPSVLTVPSKSYSLIIRISLTQKLALTNAVSVSRKVIGRPNIKLRQQNQAWKHDSQS
jgi:hypothetical protein